MKKVVNPDDFIFKTDLPAVGFHYQAVHQSVKNRIYFSQFVFSFLLEGEKTVYAGNRQFKILPKEFVLFRFQTSIHCSRLIPFPLLFVME